MVNLFEKALNLYRTIVPSDAAAIEEINAKADAIFKDQNRPAIVQEIDDKKYENPSTRDLEKVIWLDNLDVGRYKDSVVTYINNNLYDKSGGNFVLDYQDFEFKQIDEVWYVPLKQVGSGNGRFEKEETQDISTTYANSSELMNLDIDESRKVVKIKTGLQDKEITTLVNTKQKILDHIYSGSEKRDDVMDQKLIKPLRVFDYNTKTKELENSRVIDVSEGHIVWKRGERALWPVNGVMTAAGFDYKLINEYLDEISDKDNKIFGQDKRITSLKSSLDSLNRLYEPLVKEHGKLGKLYFDEQKAHDKTKAKLSKWRTGFTGRVGFPLDDNSVKEKSYSVGVFSTLPIFDHGVLIGAEYTFMPNTSTTLPLVETNYEEFTSGNPIFGETTGFVKGEVGGSTDVARHRILGKLGVNFGDGWFVTGKAGIQRNTLTEYLWSTTGFLTEDGVPYDVNKMQTDSREKTENQTVVGLELTKFFGPVSISKGVNYNTVTEEIDVNVGADIALNELFD